LIEQLFGESLHVFVRSIFLFKVLVVEDDFLAEILVGKVRTRSTEQGKVIGQVATPEEVEYGRY